MPEEKKKKQKNRDSVLRLLTQPLESFWCPHKPWEKTDKDAGPTEKR